MEDQFFISWYRQYGRKFPWRENGVTPFQLLATELLLHQTRAEQVEEMWKSFFDRFPDAETLSGASSREIFELIKDLGLGNKRTKTLKTIASHIAREANGEVPGDPDSLLKIPGVGLYTASAVRCFAFNQRVPLVDANVLRLASRLEGRKIEQRDVRRNDWVWEWAHSLLPEDPENVEAHNYGMLDFTAQVCKPRLPRCVECPLVEICSYGQRSTQHDH